MTAVVFLIAAGPLVGTLAALLGARARLCGLAATLGAALSLALAVALLSNSVYSSAEMTTCSPPTSRSAGPACPCSLVFLSASYSASCSAESVARSGRPDACRRRYARGRLAMPPLPSRRR